MKTKKLKQLAIFLLLLPFCVALLGAGCDDGQDTQCYKGKVVNLNNGDGCNNIIEILKTIDNGGSLLTLGSTITFDPDLYSDTLKVGDIVYFKVIAYEKWEGPATANCIWPGLIGQIEFCNN